MLLLNIAEPSPLFSSPLKIISASPGTTADALFFKFCMASISEFLSCWFSAEYFPITVGLANFSINICQSFTE